VKTAALDLARERQAHEAGARTRATAHERTPQQERQKAAREAERGREAWTLGVMSRDVVLAPARNDTVPIQEVSVQTARH
jgi:hypothetical protein